MTTRRAREVEGGVGRLLTSKLRTPVAAEAVLALPIRETGNWPI